MKNSLLTIILLAILTVTDAQTNYLMWSDVNTAQFGKEVLFRDSNNKFLNGSYKIAENNGSYSEVSFNQGKMIGDKKDYDFNGKLEHFTQFKDGEIHGKSTAYHQDGSIDEEGFFDNGEKDGTWKTFDKKGVLRNTEKYIKGKKNGTWIQKLYYPQTGMNTTVTKYYKNDKAIGTWQEIDEEEKLRWTKIYSSDTDYEEKEFYPNQKLSSIENYVDRKLEGSATYYNQDGILLSKRNYKKGHVIFENEYFENGNLKQVTYYKYGNKEGVFEKYNEEGIKRKEGTYKNGYKHGEWRHYDSEGELVTTHTYENDVKNGISKTYNEAARVASEGVYVNDERDGLWKFHKMNGKLLKEVEYKLGKEVSEKKYK